MIGLWLILRNSPELQPCAGDPKNLLVRRNARSGIIHSGRLLCDQVAGNRIVNLNMLTIGTKVQGTIRAYAKPGISICQTSQCAGVGQRISVTPAASGTDHAHELPVPGRFKSKSHFREPFQDLPCVQIHLQQISCHRFGRAGLFMKAIGRD